MMEVTIKMTDIDTLSGEFIEINNIIALAKADDGIKRLLLDEIIKEFGDELQLIFYEYFGAQGLIK